MSISARRRQWAVQIPCDDNIRSVWITWRNWRSQINPSDWDERRCRRVLPHPYSSHQPRHRRQCQTYHVDCARQYHFARLFT